MRQIPACYANVAPHGEEVLLLFNVLLCVLQDLQEKGILLVAERNGVTRILH